MSHSTCSFHKSGAKDGNCVKCSDTKSGCTCDRCIAYMKKLGIKIKKIIKPTN